MRKAISEIIVVVMLLMISVAIVGVAYVFFMGFQEQTKSEVQQSGTESLKRIGSCLKVVSFDDKTNNLYVKNCGRHLLSNFTVMIDNKPIYVDDAIINLNEIKAFVVYSDSKGTHEVKLLGDYASAMAAVDVKTPATFGFSLSLDPASGSVNAGSTITTSVNAKLIYGESKSVQLSCSKLPPGVTCSFAPATLIPTDDGVSSALTISTGTGLPDKYKINIGGVGDGLVRNATYELTINGKYVFVTSITFHSDLAVEGSNRVLAVADANCTRLANKSGLVQNKRIFKAWLSNSTHGARDRLTHSSVPYVRTDGVVVANDWNDLITDNGDGNYLRNPIQKDEYKNTVSDYVWTATNSDGSLADQYSNCGDWTEWYWYRALTGRSERSDRYWTFEDNRGCFFGKRLYCFEQ